MRTDNGPANLRFELERLEYRCGDYVDGKCDIPAELPTVISKRFDPDDMEIVRHTRYNIGTMHDDAMPLIRYLNDKLHKQGGEIVLTVKQAETFKQAVDEARANPEKASTIIGKPAYKGQFNDWFFEQLEEVSDILGKAIDALKETAPDQDVNYSLHVYPELF